MTLMAVPAASALAVQVAPPAAPRPARPPVVAPRALPPAKGDVWRDFEMKMPDFRFEKPDWQFEMPDFHYDMPDSHFDMPDFHYDMPDFHFDMPDKHFELPKLPYGLKMDKQLDRKLDKQFDKQIDKRFDNEIDRFDKQLHDFDASMADFTWKADVLRGEARESFRTSPRSAWLQGDIADSLYRSAYELLNRGEWRRSAAAFASIPQRYPNSGYVADALYWQAFSLYRIGNTDDLQNALRSLELMRTRYPQAKTQSDAAALTARIRGTLATRGDRDAAQKLRDAVNGQATQCDREDQAVRAEAMKSLAQTDPGALPALAKRVLAKKDACSAPLRRTAVYLLGNSGDNETLGILRDVALNDSEPEVRSAALQYLARSPNDVAVNTLDEVLRSSTDQSVQRTAARALASNPNPRARQAVRALIERSDAPERLRIEAIGGFEDSQRTTDEDAAYLRSIYTKIDNPRIKARIARVLGQLGGDQNDQWLLGLMRNNDEPLEVRSAALSRVASRKMPIGDAVKLYASVSDRDMRQQLINIYGQRTEPEATDKLLDIVKNDTDYNLRRQAINALTRKNDPRATKLLLEIIDK
jgi:HEAT repeat protein